MFVILAGLVAGSVAAFLTNPFETVTAQMQV